ncbi:MAG: hypothetical protein OXC95_02860 [Dehalococcoidia bacterium]|nr:hypothetical protein [Dehalococcoidia bacterium]
MSEQHETTLFWDRNLDTAIPTALQTLSPPGLMTRYYFEIYPNTDNMPEDGDAAWLEDVGDLGWFVISQDRRLHRRERERAALMRHNVGCFYLWGANASKWDTFRCFSLAYDRIVEAMNHATRPFIYRIYKDGTLRQIEL